MILSWPARMSLTGAILALQITGTPVPDSIPRESYRVVGNEIASRSHGDVASVDLERRGGKGAFFLLINATPWAFTQVDQHQYQMTAWEFPQSIPPGKSSTVTFYFHCSVLAG